MHIRGSSTAICRISLRFFSPPEKPTLTGRFSISASMSSVFALSRTSFRNSAAFSSASPRAFRCAFSAVRRKVRFPTPGISTGYWNARNSPSAARSSGSIARRSTPVQRRRALGHLVAVAARQHVAERRLARAVRPHDRMHLAGPNLEVDALEDRLVLLLELHVQVLDLQHVRSLPNSSGAASATRRPRPPAGIPEPSPPPERQRRPASAPRPAHS